MPQYYLNYCYVINVVMHIEIMHYIVLCGYNVIKLLYPMVCYGIQIYNMVGDNII